MVSCIFLFPLSICKHLSGIFGGFHICVHSMVQGQPSLLSLVVAKNYEPSYHGGGVFLGLIWGGPVNLPHPSFLEVIHGSFSTFNSTLYATYSPRLVVHPRALTESRVHLRNFVCHKDNKNEESITSIIYLSQ